MYWIQQGDVLIQPERIPKRPRKTRGRVLAEGELTGHAHRLTTTSDALLVEIDGLMYLSVGPGGARIEHEEHHAVDLIEGDYRISRVREYDHFKEEVREVHD